MGGAHTVRTVRRLEFRQGLPVTVGPLPANLGRVPVQPPPPTLPIGPHLSTRRREQNGCIATAPEFCLTTQHLLLLLAPPPPTRILP